MRTCPRAATATRTPPSAAAGIRASPTRGGRGSHVPLCGSRDAHVPPHTLRQPWDLDEAPRLLMCGPKKLYKRLQTVCLYHKEKIDIGVSRRQPWDLDEAPQLLMGSLLMSVNEFVGLNVIEDF